MISCVGLIGALGCNVFLAFVDKRSSSELTNNKDILFFSFLKTLTCALFAIFCLPMASMYINIAGIIIALFAGFFHAASVVLIMKSLRNTLAVYVNLFMGAGVVIPTIMGVFLLNQAMTWIKASCLILLIVALALTLNAKTGRKVNLRLLLPMFLCYGMLMCMQGLFPKYCTDGSGAIFSVVMYGSSALLLGLITILKRKDRQHLMKSTYLLGFISAAFNLAINMLLTNLSATFDAVVVFPTVHGLKLVIVTLLSSVVWKEKISGIQILGSFVAIICVCVLAI